MRRPLKFVWITVTIMFATGGQAANEMDAGVADTIRHGERREFLRYWQPPDSPDKEAYIEEPLPPGFQVIVTPLEGPVFADARGRTLYVWELRSQRNGQVGDRPGRPSSCTDEVIRVSVGFMSPYPAGLLLPDLDSRVSCVSVWPPVLAPDDAEPVGKWSVIARNDGTRQWAYDGQPLYTSILDRQAGDVRGGTKMRSGGDAGAGRDPAAPRSLIPPAFEVVQSSTGRLVLLKNGYSVYSWDGDEPNKSNCHGDCLNSWNPVAAPENVTEKGGWTTFERAPGINQWAFRGKPLYTSNFDTDERSFMGSDVPGWHNVYTQRAPFPPDSFTVQDAIFGGQVLADARGRTIYLYNCIEDTLDQLACNNPDTTQAYRLAICGNGDPALCRETFPYVEAPPDATSASPLWSVIAIDPNTGHSAAPDRADALHVWAYLGRPVYTYAGDAEPGVLNGQGLGEFAGTRNGYRAFILRDIFQDSEFRRP